LILASAALGALTMVASNRIAGRDLAGKLASALGIGSGPLLGSLLGALTGAWLVSGGRRRIAGLLGLACGLAAAAALWGIGRGHLWVVDVVLEGTFGAGADGFSVPAVVVVLFVLARLIADVVSATTRRLLDRPAGSSQLLAGGRRA
jgi:hypothetical protein